MLDIEEKEASILLNFNSKPALEVFFSEKIETSFKGIEMRVNQVTGMRIDKNFEGEETYFDITKA